jgi:Rod binding domain-containing protein
MDNAALTLQARISGGVDPLSPQVSGALNAKADYQRFQKIGQEFEGILVRQMLRELRTGSMVSGADSVNSGYRAMVEDQLADSLARGGGFGMADAFARQMMGQIRAAELIDLAGKAVNIP